MEYSNGFIPVDDVPERFHNSKAREQAKEILDQFINSEDKIICSNLNSKYEANKMTASLRMLLNAMDVKWIKVRQRKDTVYIEKVSANEMGA